MKRKEGYYWVRDNDSEWRIAEWDELYGWFVCGVEYPVGDDTTWDEIGEKIERVAVVESTSSLQTNRD